MNSKQGEINPYMYRLLSGLLLGVKRYQLYDDLLTTNAMAFDYNGDIYNCFRLWGQTEYKVNNNIINDLLRNINNKENNEMCGSVK